MGHRAKIDGAVRELHVLPQAGVRGRRGASPVLHIVTN